MSDELAGLSRRSLEERRELIAGRLGITRDSLDEALAGGGLDEATANRAIENVLGTLSLPFAVATRFVVDTVPRLIPMAVEEPSVVAAASAGAKRIASGGGFTVETDPPITTAEVELLGVPNVDAAAAALAAAEPQLRQKAAEVLPGLEARGGGLREIELRAFEGSVLVHLHVDCRDAMGANLVNTLAEGLRPELARIGRGEAGVAIVTNLADRRKVRVRARVSAEALGGLAVRDGIARMSTLAERDPYRATTHNKGIMNGVDAVVVATGNDWRAVEAGAHAWAARSGRYQPLCRWWAEGDDLMGELEMPLAVGTVGGIGRIHRLARFAIELSGAQSAMALAGFAAAAGMACNLSATRALVTDGIQAGHMALHARSVAAAAGAVGDEVDEVARRIHQAGTVSMDAARAALSELRRAR